MITDFFFLFQRALIILSVYNNKTLQLLFFFFSNILNETSLNNLSIFRQSTSLVCEGATSNGVAYHDATRVYLIACVKATLNKG